MGTKEFTRLTLLAMVGSGGLLNTRTIFLFDNDVDVTPATVVGDLNEVTQTGMVAQAGITFSTPFDPGTGIEQSTADVAPFIATVSVASPFLVFGYAVTDAAKAILVAVKKFETPVVIDEPGKGVDFTAVVALASPEVE